MITLESKTDRLKFSTILGATGFGAISFALFPLLSTFAILSLSFGLFHSHDRWTKSDAFPLPKTPPLETTEKYILLGTIFTLGIVFSLSSVLSQILVGTLASFALSSYFITQCIINPQQKLNNALKNATSPKRIRALLKRGAEPLNGIYEKVTFKSILAEMEEFRGEAFLNQIKNWYRTLTPLFNDHSLPNRIAFYEASERLFEEIMRPLFAMLNKGVKYLQQQTYTHQIDNENISFENEWSAPILITPKQSTSAKPSEKPKPAAEQPLNTGRQRKSRAI